MSKEEIIAKIKTDPYFAAKFAVDNNPSGIIDKLRSLGYGNNFSGNLQSDKLTALKIILQLTNEKNPQLLQLFSDLNYLNNDKNSEDYTKGFRDYFIEQTPSSMVNQNNYKAKGEFSFDGLMFGIGSGLMSYANFSSAQQTKTAAETVTEADKKKIEEQLTAEKKRRNWLIAGVITFVVIVTTVIIITVNKKGSKRD